jgi:hypothetical protein
MSLLFANFAAESVVFAGVCDLLVVAAHGYYSRGVSI